MHADKSLHVFLFCGQPSAGPLPPATALHDPSAPRLSPPPACGQSREWNPQGRRSMCRGFGLPLLPSWSRVGTVGAALVLRDCMPRPPCWQSLPLIRGKTAGLCYSLLFSPRAPGFPRPSGTGSGLETFPRSKHTGVTVLFLSHAP